jgi:hypothetical protein
LDGHFVEPAVDSPINRDIAGGATIRPGDAHQIRGLVERPDDSDVRKRADACWGNHGKRGQEEDRPVVARYGVLEHRRAIRIYGLPYAQNSALEFDFSALRYPEPDVRRAKRHFLAQVAGLCFALYRDSGRLNGHGCGSQDPDIQRDDGFCVFQEVLLYGKAHLLFESGHALLFRARVHLIGAFLL